MSPVLLAFFSRPIGLNNAQIGLAAVLPAFYSSVAGSTLSPVRASGYWGFTNAIAVLPMEEDARLARPRA